MQDNTGYLRLLQVTTGCTHENTESESIEQASTKVVNSRDYKTQGQSKLKVEQEQILEKTKNANLFQTHVTPSCSTSDQVRTVIVIFT